MRQRKLTLERDNFQEIKFALGMVKLQVIRILKVVIANEGIKIGSGQIKLKLLIINRRRNEALTKTAT